MSIFFRQGLPARVPRVIPEEEIEQLNNRARNLGAIKTEYVANLLHPHEKLYSCRVCENHISYTNFKTLFSNSF